MFVSPGEPKLAQGRRFAKVIHFVVAARSTALNDRQHYRELGDAAKSNRKYRVRRVHMSRCLSHSRNLRTILLGAGLIKFTDRLVRQICQARGNEKAVRAD